MASGAAVSTAYEITRGINGKYRSAVGISQWTNGRFRPKSLEDERIQESAGRTMERNKLE